MNQNDWAREIKNCKKFHNNRVKRDINYDFNFENKKSKKFECDNYKFKFDHDFSYKIDKNESFGIDRNTDKKLKSGKFKIDLKLDFHGFTLDEAFDFLLYSVETAYNQGFRCLLVVTGKGKNTKQGRDSIKSQISNWLQHPNISSKIIKYVDADIKHGGTGAIYILLKRNKAIENYNN